MPYWLVWILKYLIPTSLSLLVSLYAAEIRQSFRSSHQKVNQRRLESAQHRLRLLQALHQDTYRLLLYFLWELTGALTIQYISWILLFILIIWLIQLHDPVKIIPSFWGMLGGGFFARFAALRRTVLELYDYDRTIADLEGKIKALSGETS